MSKIRSPSHAALLAASPATLDRLLQPVRRRRARQPRRAASAVTAVKSQIPIRTWGDWADVTPGALQGDLVLHCGKSTAGYSLKRALATGTNLLRQYVGVGKAIAESVKAFKEKRPPRFTGR